LPTVEKRLAAPSSRAVAQRVARTTECGFGRRFLGHTCHFQGDFIEAQANLVEVLSIYDSERDREARFRFSGDTGTIARACLANTKWQFGEVGPARALIEEAVAHAIETSPILSRSPSDRPRSLRIVSSRRQASGQPGPPKPDALSPSSPPTGLFSFLMFISRPHPWPTSANQILNLTVHRWAIFSI
jgi:hypothetical protein